MTHTEDNKAMLSQGVYIFVYLAVLTVLEFLIAVTFKSVPILVVVALVKAVLVVYYYMHIYELNIDHEGDHESYEYKSGTNRLGLWLFLISDSFVFGGLMVMRINLLGLTHPNLNQFLGLGVTSVLLISSFFMNRGETMMKNGNRQGFLNNTMITFALGALFFIGVIFVEWRLAAHEGLIASFGDPNRGPVGAVFYMMTGMHAFHVLTGLIFLGVVWNNARKGLYDELHYPVEAAAIYWHFVDVVWIFFYPALYLIGTAIL
jgi:cytochrome c oxidase subunit III